MMRILVDMDGVLADVYTRFAELYEEETGLRKTPSELVGYKEGESYPEVLRWVETPGFFRTLPVMHDSQRVLKLLKEVYEIIIVSMATEFPYSLTDKQLWLNEHFPFISWKQVVFCGNKSLVPGDFMIDDHLKNLDNFKGTTVMYTQPHNIDYSDPRHIKVSTWADIESFFLPGK